MKGELIYDNRTDEHKSTNYNNTMLEAWHNVFQEAVTKHSSTGSKMARFQIVNTKTLGVKLTCVRITMCILLKEVAPVQK